MPTRDLPTNIQPGDPEHVVHHDALHDLLNPVFDDWVVTANKQGLLVDRPTDLDTDNPGFEYWSTDLKRKDRWNGVSWDEGINAGDIPTTFGVRYAAPWGDDADDGLTWGTAKEHIMSAYDSLPAGGGTVYFADETNATATAGQGIWLAGAGDPNYGSLPAGWRQKKNVSQFIGIGGSQVGSRRGPQAIMHGGHASDATKPAVAFSDGSVLVIENMATDYVYRPIRIGMNSNGVAMSSSYVVGAYLSNIQPRVAGDANAGPNISFESAADTSFWHVVEWCDAFANTNAAIGNDHRAVILATGTYLLQVEHCIWTFGGLKYTTPSTSWNLLVHDIQGEGNFANPIPPMVDIYGSQPAGFAKISFTSVFDAPGTEAVVRNNTLPAQCVIVDGLGEAGAYAVRGPHNNLGYERISFGSLAAMASLGPERWRNVGRRGFAPTSTLQGVVQLANHDPTAWTGRSHGGYPSGGNATVTPVPGFNGVAAQGGRFSYVGAGDLGIREILISRSLAVGDFLVFAVWIDRRVGDIFSCGAGTTLATAGFEATEDILGAIGSPDANLLTCRPSGAGELNYNAERPSFRYYIARVTTIGANPCAIANFMTVANGQSADYFAPQFYHFPGSTWTAEQVANFVDGMGTIPYMPNLFGDDNGGDLTAQFGQRIIAPGGIIAALDQDTALAAGGLSGTVRGSFVAYKAAAGQYYRLQAQGVAAWDMLMRTQVATGDRFAIQNGGGSYLELASPADGETALLIRRDVGGSETLQRVSMGAADSGGAGFKSLRVPN